MWVDFVWCGIQANVEWSVTIRSLVTPTNRRFQPGHVSIDHVCYQLGGSHVSIFVRLQLQLISIRMIYRRSLEIRWTYVTHPSPPIDPVNLLDLPTPLPSHICSGLLGFLKYSLVFLLGRQRTLDLLTPLMLYYSILYTSQSVELACFSDASCFSFALILWSNLIQI